MIDIKELIERLKIHLQSHAAYNNPDLACVLEDAADALEKLQVELEQAKAERDAAVRDLKLCAGFGDSLCHFCKTDSEECSSCISGTRWQWRGRRCGLTEYGRATDGLRQAD